jgi:hypothetical protein
VEQSLALYEEIKSYFSIEENTSLIIEISNTPINEWETSLVSKRDDETNARVKALRNPNGFAAFTYSGTEKEFHFFDYNISKGEDLFTKKILFFDTEESKINEFKLAAREIPELIKLLKNIAG